MLLARTPKELAEGKAKVLAEYKALPDKSGFGDDNRAAEKMAIQTFEKLEGKEEGEELDSMLDHLYDLQEISSAIEYTVGASIHIVYWAGGEEDEL